MTSAMAFLLIGLLLVAMGFTRSAVDRLPVTTAMLYLGVGLVAGPTLLQAYHFNPLKQSQTLELITELAVLLSLYTAGVKMPGPFSLRRWRTTALLATVALTVTIAVMAVFGYVVLGLSAGAAILLAGILAPTDPVLATDVQVRHPGDRDRLRLALTSEAGLNDGTAFPFVLLGLGLLGIHPLGEAGTAWVLRDVLWASAAGVGIGLAAGVLVGHAAVEVRRRWPDAVLMDDFVGLGLIATVYGLTVSIHAYGFLAVFAAAVALRQTEVRAEPLARNRITDASLLFKEQLERFSEVVVILLVGGTLFLNSWSWRAVATALFLFVVARPLGVWLGLLGSRAPRRMRMMTAWFGVRGIGSLYYLMYAIDQGLSESVALELIHITLIVVTLSILVHGISVKPMLSRYWHRGSRHRRPAAVP
ncbi:K(+)/H(+) antiporter NhaP [wastewater metagenome]|uniref:K(+)/H(+) antiporter NhaP n=2 Tax=unclassified sequences TaxID=12908 RepID=A0A5B8R8H0_9ZZZZ|nr:cation:proton antiporter [Arhodomonas aquaeolei]MCS4505214.1 cation:proton antiporter [Arhodomonas aquaeolei]QEA05000.1 K(+)/H(+) antiporter NhaP [uncultured organism]